MYAIRSYYVDDAKLAECKAEYAKDGIDVYTINFNVCSSYNFV